MTRSASTGGVSTAGGVRVGPEQALVSGLRCQLPDMATCTSPPAQSPEPALAQEEQDRPLLPAPGSPRTVTPRSPAAPELPPTPGTQVTQRLSPNSKSATRA